MLPIPEEENDRLLAFAVLGGGERVFTGTDYVVLTENLSIAAIAKDDRKLTYIPSWYILRNRFVLRGEKYRLLTLIPDTEDKRASLAEVEARSFSVTDFIRLLISYTDNRFVSNIPISQKQFFKTVALAAREEISDRITFSEASDLTDSITETDPQALACTIGMLLVGICRDTQGSVSLSLVGAPAKRHIFISSPPWQPNRFLEALLEGITALCHVELVREKDGFALSIPQSHTTALPLRAVDEKNISRLFRLLKFWSEKPPEPRQKNF